MSEHRKLTDEAVMAIVCANGADDGRRAFADLVRRWEQRIHRLCFRLTGNTQDAEDATQEALARVFAKRDQFRGDAKFSTWLWRIAVNAATDLQRRKRAVSPQHESISHDGPVSASVTSENRHRVREALAELPDQLRSVVVLRHYEQLKFREIAETLGIPQGTVASRMADALDRLGRKLQDNDSSETRSC